MLRVPGPDDCSPEIPRGSEAAGRFSEQTEMFSF